MPVHAESLTPQLVLALEAPCDNSDSAMQSAAADLATFLCSLNCLSPTHPPIIKLTHSLMPPQHPQTEQCHGTKSVRKGQHDANGDLQHSARLCTETSCDVQAQRHAPPCMMQTSAAAKTQPDALTRALQALDPHLHHQAHIGPGKASAPGRDAHGGIPSQRPLDRPVNDNVSLSGLGAWTATAVHPPAHDPIQSQHPSNSRQNTGLEAPAEGSRRGAVQQIRQQLTYSAARPAALSTQHSRKPAPDRPHQRQSTPLSTWPPQNRVLRTEMSAPACKTTPQRSHNRSPIHGRSRTPRSAGACKRRSSASATRSSTQWQRWQTAGSSQSAKRRQSPQPGRAQQYPTRRCRHHSLSPRLLQGTVSSRAKQRSKSPRALPGSSNSPQAALKQVQQQGYCHQQAQAPRQVKHRQGKSSPAQQRYSCTPTLTPSWQRAEETWGHAHDPLPAYRQSCAHTQTHMRALPHFSHPCVHAHSHSRTHSAPLAQVPSNQSHRLQEDIVVSHANSTRTDQAHTQDSVPPELQSSGHLRRAMKSALVQPMSTACSVCHRHHASQGHQSHAASRQAACDSPARQTQPAPTLCEDAVQARGHCASPSQCLQSPRLTSRQERNPAAIEEPLQHSLPASVHGKVAGLQEEAPKRSLLHCSWPPHAVALQQTATTSASQLAGQASVAVQPEHGCNLTEESALGRGESSEMPQGQRQSSRGQLGTVHSQVSGQSLSSAPTMTFCPPRSLPHQCDAREDLHSQVAHCECSENVRGVSLDLHRPLRAALVDALKPGSAHVGGRLGSRVAEPGKPSEQAARRLVPSLRVERHK